MKFKTALIPLTMPFLLAACLGGGGGGGSGGGGSSSAQADPPTLDSTPSSFTSFSDLGPNELVEAEAGGGSLNYSADVDEDGDVAQDGEETTLGSTLLILTGPAIEDAEPDSFSVAAEGEDEPDFDVEALRLTIDLPNGETLTADFTAEEDGPGDSALFVGERQVTIQVEDGDNPDQFIDNVIDVTDRLYVTDDDELDYMTFGIWEIGEGLDSVDLGGSAWGNPTSVDQDAVNPMPLAGTAEYEGGLIAHNVRSEETRIYTATSLLVADFTEGEVTFSSTGTQRLDGFDAEPELLDIEPTTVSIEGNTFSSDTIDIAAPGNFEGGFGGAFYGANAAEAGGWFNVTNTDNDDRYFGSFGGKRGDIVPPQ